MMFKDPKNVGSGEHFLLVFNNGGTMNGTTNEDRPTTSKRCRRTNSTSRSSSKRIA